MFPKSGRVELHVKWGKRRNFYNKCNNKSIKIFTHRRKMIFRLMCQKQKWYNFCQFSSPLVKRKSFSYFCKNVSSKCEKKKKKKRQTVYRQMRGSTRGWQKSCGITFPLFRCNEILRKIWRCVDPFSGWKWIRSYRTELHGPLASTTFRPETLPFFPSPPLPFSSFFSKPSPRERRIFATWCERDSSHPVPFPFSNPIVRVKITRFFFYFFA